VINVLPLGNLVEGSQDLLDLLVEPPVIAECHQQESLRLPREA
jgi:hypothetical protein